MKDDHRSRDLARWGLLMTRHLPDGRTRLQPVRDSTTGEPVAFATEAEAQAFAARMASAADTEFRAAPLRILGERPAAVEDQEEKR
jgi:hypothetical protein